MPTLDEIIRPRRRKPTSALIYCTGSDPGGYRSSMEGCYTPLSITKAPKSSVESWVVEFDVGGGEIQNDRFVPSAWAARSGRRGGRYGFTLNGVPVSVEDAIHALKVMGKN